MTSEQDQQNVASENYDEMEDEMTPQAYEEEPYTQSEDDGGTQFLEEEATPPDEIFSRLGESSDDPEQKRHYLEYLSLINYIDCQNKLVEDMKKEILDLCDKNCKTVSDIKEIKRRRLCMEQEYLKLRCLMQQAIKLQNFGSHRRYRDLPLATTIDEDNMSPYVHCQPTMSSNWRGDSNFGDDNDKCTCHVQSNSKVDSHVGKMCRAMNKIKTCCPDDKKVIKEIAAALMCHKKKKKQQEICNDPSAKEQQRSMYKCKSHHQQGDRRESLDNLRQKICSMQSTVNKLKQEICRRESERNNQHDHSRHEFHNHHECDQQQEQQGLVMSREEPNLIEMECLAKRKTKSDQLNKLKENYLYLLSEFSKKDCQLKELEKRMKGVCGGCSESQGQFKANADESELYLLRNRVSELKEEQVEFKCIMKEQSQQLEDYRNKYLMAQQKVEEHTVTLEKLNMNNKRIEKQINCEIKEIRAKFQEKLNELLHFPKLLENEQLKLAQVCKEKEELQNKLAIICKELKSLKSNVTQPTEDCRPQLAKCQLELSQTKSQIEELERQRDLFCEQLKTTQDDLDTLRSESAKIIARTKERAEMMKMQSQEQVDRLEKELSQCRATACLSVSDREAVIREMQGQLNTLSFSFDSAQKQIKTLRNHIAYVSNENCYPVKC